MNFDTILFDLDDTLLDRNKSLRKFIKLFIQKYAGDLVINESKQFEDIFMELDCCGYRPRNEMFMELLRSALWISKPGISEVMDYWNIGFPQCAEPVSQLYEVLNYLLDKGIKMGIVTNSLTHFQYAKINKLSLNKYMRAILISEEVGISKPDPAIFQLALSRMDSLPETTLFVGDYPSIDIKGAWEARIKSVWISYGKPWDIREYKLDYTINELSDLINLVEKYGEKANLD